DELCRRSDFVSMHALLNDSTRRMFGEAQFRAMKPTAYFVNTSRGGTVDERALIRALREGWIAGAGLDVLDQEPPDPANPLLSMPNVLLTAHTAGHSEDAMADNREQSVGKVLGFLQGRWPDTGLNPEVEAGAAARARAFRRGGPARGPGAPAPAGRRPRVIDPSRAPDRLTGACLALGHRCLRMRHPAASPSPVGRRKPPPILPFADPGRATAP